MLEARNADKPHHGEEKGGSTITNQEWIERGFQEMKNKAGNKHLLLDHQDAIYALLCCAFLAARSRDFQVLRLACNTLFLLGYQAGQETVAGEPDPGIWGE